MQDVLLKTTTGARYVLPLNRHRGPASTATAAPLAATPRLGRLS